jgi:Thioredoxin domain-containing protein
MTRVLNFNRLLFTTILSFVSFLDVTTTYAQTKGLKEDDFAMFADEMDSAPKTKTGQPALPAIVKEDPKIKIERLKTDIKANPKNLKLIIDLAETYYEDKQFENTTTLLWKQVDKLDRNGLLLLARAHQQKKEASDMIRVLNILIGKDAKNYEAQSLLGDAQVMQKRPKEAMEAYKASIEINAKYEPPYLGIVKIYEGRTPPNLYELRILFQDMVDNIGPRPEYLTRLCEINFKDGAFETAIAKCKEAIQKDSSIAENYVYQALSEKASEQVESATKKLKFTADKFPKSELAQYSYAKNLEEQKNFVDAFKYYQVATVADAKSSRSWLGLATSAFEIRKYDVALEAYKKACKFDHKLAVNFRKAATSLKMSRNSEWAGRYDQAAEICSF